ncbi:hypothetical protein T03_7566 [Trichinella britovi]|uniref:Uncharacterized protein n=1 Tax=Trichinella britovi TaxID=45882 RepID=A0A0V1C6L8_TRIBR|nr:hypothetical protein T03_7566 [Trichinella britovi]
MKPKVPIYSFELNFKERRMQHTKDLSCKCIIVHANLTRNKTVTFQNLNKLECQSSVPFETEPFYCQPNINAEVRMNVHIIASPFRRSSVMVRHFTAVNLRSALHQVIERATDWQLSYQLR